MSNVQQSILAYLIQQPHELRLFPSDSDDNLFSDTLSSDIFLALKVLYAKNLPITKDTICDWATISSESKIPRSDFMAYINQISLQAISPATFQQYLRLLKASEAKKKLKSLGYKLHSEDTFRDKDIEQIIQTSITELYRLRTSIMETPSVPESVNTAELFIRVMKQISGSKKNPNFSNQGIPSGFVEFDKVTGGWQEGDLIIVGARPGMGKTALMLSWINQLAAKTTIPMLYFSLDTPPERLMLRLISNSSGLSDTELMLNVLDADSLSRIHESAEHLSDAKFYPVVPVENSIEEIIMTAERFINEKKVKIIFIDFLQLLTVRDNKFKTRDAEIGHITRQLKKFAQRNRITIIVSSQLSREVERRSSAYRRPVLSDLRDSGAIEQDASKVVFIYRPKYYGLTEDELGRNVKGQGYLILAKNNSGLCDEFRMDFDGKCSRFTESEKPGFSFNSLRQDDFDDEPPF